MCEFLLTKNGFVCVRFDPQLPTPSEREDNRHMSLQAAHIPVPVRHLSHIHADLVGPLPRSSGFS